MYLIENLLKILHCLFEKRELFVMSQPLAVVDSAFKCAFCSGTSLAEVLDLGTVALAGGFLQPDQFFSELQQNRLTIAVLGDDLR